MEIKIYRPSELLKNYVDCYFTLKGNPANHFRDLILPGGRMEIAFNLGEAVWTSGNSTQLQKDPAIELLGQMTEPRRVETSGRIDMLCIRFFPHTACFFIEENLGSFTNQISSLTEVLGVSTRDLHGRLIETTVLEQQLKMIDNYLLNRLNRNRIKNISTLNLVGRITMDLEANDHEDQIYHAARRNGISTRYLHKIFSRYIGVSPKRYLEIHRFKGSLDKIKAGQSSLTSIAYDCGYSDQSHFIREFKSFSGSTPSNWLKNQVATAPVQ
jgi:AraC-like DNA-binding protein